jgi:hypothetical protein
MSEMKYTIVDSWPALKDDIQSFLSDTDCWAISQIKEVYKSREWNKLSKIIDIMETLHSISHSH